MCMVLMLFKRELCSKLPTKSCSLMLTSCSCVSDGRGYVLCEVVSDGVCKESTLVLIL